MSVLAKILDLTKLKPNWDSYNAPSIDAGAIFRAGVIAQSVIQTGIIQDCAVVPLSSGGVQLEWHRDGYSIEISITLELKP